MKFVNNAIEGRMNNSLGMCETLPEEALVAISGGLEDVPFTILTIPFCGTRAPRPFPVVPPQPRPWFFGPDPRVV
jgi:hypothetical protein